MWLKCTTIPGTGNFFVCETVKTHSIAPATPSGPVTQVHLLLPNTYPVSPSKSEIKAWLKRERHSRKWLGEQCGVEKRTVDNWLSSPKEIPHATLALIARLMEDDENQPGKNPRAPARDQYFSLEVDIEMFRSFSKAALAAGLTLEDWVIQICQDAVEANPPATGPEKDGGPRPPGLN